MKLTLVSAAVLSVLAAHQVHAEEQQTDSKKQQSTETVIVTAHKFEQELNDVAGSVAVVDGEKVEDLGQTDLYDSLRGIPGVTVTGGAGRPQNIIIRGMTGNRIAIYKDGIRSSDGFGANDLNDKVGRNAFDMADVKSIEIIKGASSSLYGSGAIGGAVIVHTKKASDYLQGNDYYADARVNYTGISNQYKASSALAFRLGELDSLINVAYWHGEETTSSNSSTFDREVPGYSASYSSHFFINENWILNTKFNAYREEQSNQYPRSVRDKDGMWLSDGYEEEAYSQEFGASVGVEHTPFGGALYDEMEAKVFWRSTENSAQSNNNLRFHQLDQNGHSILRRRVDDAVFKDELMGLSVNGLNSVEFAAHPIDFAYGMSYENSTFERTVNRFQIDDGIKKPEHKQPFVPARQHVLGAYFRSATELNDWMFSAGLRFDAHQLTASDNDEINGHQVKDISSSELSPSASATYRLNEHHNVYLSYSHGYRAPTYDKAYGAVNHDFVPITPFEIIPNMDLEAETSDSIELGTKYQNEKVQIQLAWFYTKFDNFIDERTMGLNSTTNLWEKQYINIDEVFTQGFEASSMAQISDHFALAATLGYVTGENGDGEYVSTLTPWEGSVSINYDLENLHSFATLNWAASMDRVPMCSEPVTQREFECVKTDSWHSIDMGVSYDITKNLRLSGTVINVLDQDYMRYQDVAGVSEQQATLHGTGRYFTLNARYIF